MLRLLTGIFIGVLLIPLWTILAIFELFEPLFPGAKDLSYVDPSDI